MHPSRTRLQVAHKCRYGRVAFVTLYAAKASQRTTTAKTKAPAHTQGDNARPSLRLLRAKRRRAGLSEGNHPTTRRRRPFTALTVSAIWPTHWGCPKSRSVIFNSHTVSPWPLARWGMRAVRLQQPGPDRFPPGVTFFMCLSGCHRRHPIRRLGVGSGLSGVVGAVAPDRPPTTTSLGRTPPTSSPPSSQEQPTRQRICAVIGG